MYYYYASKSLILPTSTPRGGEHAGRRVRPVLTAREALHQYTVRLLTNIAETPRGWPYWQGSPTSPRFTDEQYAEVREKAKSRPTSMSPA